MTVPAIRLSALFSRTADGVFVSDANAHRILYWNRAARALLGPTADDARGKRCHEVVRGVTADGTPFCGPECPVKCAARSGHVVRHFDLITRATSGRKIRVDVSILLVRDQRRKKLWVAHLFRKMDGPTSGRRESARSAGISRPIVSGPAVSAANLTRREREVLERMADGFSTRALAARLSIRYLTARTHIQRILNKLGAHSRVEAVLGAIRSGRG